MHFMVLRECRAPFRHIPGTLLCRRCLLNESSACRDDRRTRREMNTCVHSASAAYVLRGLVQGSEIVGGTGPWRGLREALVMRGMCSSTYRS